MGSHSLSPRTASFLKLGSRPDLATWLGLSDRELRYILYVLKPDQKYQTFTIKKRSGGDRVIEAPHAALKALQRKVLGAICEIAPPSGLAKAYVSGLSIVDHAWLHRRQKHVILADLSDFFPTITFPRVRGALLSKPFELTPSVATCVAQLCCKDGVLPQGAPTSPALSNLICRSMDHALLNLARKHRFRVSRYADDICFSSSQSTIPDELAVEMGGVWSAGLALEAAVQKGGFVLNSSKFHVRGQETTQLVTGLVVNDGVSLPRWWRRQLRVLLHLMKRYGDEKAGEIAATWTNPSASRQRFTSIEQLIRGKTHYARHIDFRCGRVYSEALFRAYPEQRRLLPRPLNGTPVRLMAEGKTDLLHIEAAYRFLHKNSEFAHIRPRFVGFPGDTGDVELMKTLGRIAKANIDELTIGIFDCDNPKFMAENGLSPGGYVQLGSHVFAACLAPPEALVGKNFCIELLYMREELCAVTSDARRVFLPDEFDKVSGVSLDGMYKREHPKKSALIVSDKVVRLSDGYSSSLAKADLATLIHKEVSPFESMNFEGFRPTFRLIEGIVDLVHGR